MLEIEFEKAVVDLAHMFGWKVASFRPAQTGKGWRTPVKYDGKGYPDLTLVHHDCVIFAELKAAKGTMSDEQETWRSHLEEVEWNTTKSAIQDTPPVRYFCWKPKDAKQIADVLSFGRVTNWTL